MSVIPRSFTILGASNPAGGIVYGLNGQTITGDANGAWALAANGTNQNITLAPSGTGSTLISAGRLAFIGTTSSFPALRRTATTIDVVLADNSQWAQLSCGKGGLAVTSATGFTVINDVAATSGVTVQMSPRALFRGNAWDTAASQTVDFFIENLPASAATPTGTLKFGYSLNGGAATYPMTLNSTGLLSVAASILSLGDVSCAATNAFYFANRSQLFSPVDGSVRLSNYAATGFTSLDFGLQGAATTRSQRQKSVTAIANAVATDVLTVTIPNAAHSACLELSLTGSLGAGGAIGANEASATISYKIVITRTTGVATVVTTSTAFGSAASAVAGAATVTITAAATAMTGAVGAQQTFTVQVTISRSGGSSTNHTCLVVAEIQNANATGITIA